MIYDFCAGAIPVPNPVPKSCRNSARLAASAVLTYGSIGNRLKHMPDEELAPPPATS